MGERTGENGQGVEMRESFFSQVPLRWAVYVLFLLLLLASFLTPSLLVICQLRMRRKTHSLHDSPIVFLRAVLAMFSELQVDNPRLVSVMDTLFGELFTKRYP